MAKVNTGKLGYKASSDFQRKVSGLATIKVGENKCLVTFEDNNKHFSDGTNSHKFNLDELPKFPHLQQTPKDQEPPHYRVRLNQDATEIESITPANGKFTAKLFDFGRQTDADPLPFEKVFKEGTPQESRHLEFTALYKISRGAMKGAVAVYYLHYKFADEEGFARFEGNPENPKATRLHQLIQFCNAHKMIDDVIQWPEDGNVLPVLLERGLEADNEVNILLKDGYVNEIVQEEFYGEDFIDDENTESLDEVIDKEEDKKVEESDEEDL